MPRERTLNIPSVPEEPEEPEEESCRVPLVLYCGRRFTGSTFRRRDRLSNVLGAPETTDGSVIRAGLDSTESE